jgi:hypothetical protein
LARGRMISKSVSTSRKFAALAMEAGKLGEFAQTLYLLMIPHADDFGRLEGDPFTIKHLVLPISPRSERDFETALQAIATVGLIVWYEVDGRRFVQIVSFDEHQTGLHKRTASRFPDPSGDSGKFPEFPSEEKRTEENGREGNGTEAGAAAPGPGRPRSGQGPSPDELLMLWRETCVPVGFADVCIFDDDLRRKCRARLAEEPDLATWREAFQRVASSAFCRGDGAPRDGKKPWRADFRWMVVNVSNRAKVLEGRYDDSSRAGAGGFVG